MRKVSRASRALPIAGSLFFRRFDATAVARSRQRLPVACALHPLSGFGGRQPPPGKPSLLHPPSSISPPPPNSIGPEAAPKARLFFPFAHPAAGRLRRQTAPDRETGAPVPPAHAGVEELHLLDGELWMDERKL